MKKYTCLPLILLLSLALSACGGNASETPTPTRENVYTIVAETLSAQLTALPPVATPVPTDTPVPEEIPTLPPLDTATSQSVTLPTLPPTAIIALCDNSAFVADVTVPDGTTLTPGKTFTKTWKLSNTGTCTWTTSYALVYLRGSVMSGASKNLSASVNPGRQVNISVDMEAPKTAGTYTGYWQLQNASGSKFGQQVYVQIKVSGATTTVTPTSTVTGTPPTVTPTRTRTSTTVKTSTATSTEIVVPTGTPTPTSTETEVPPPADTPTETATSST
jgi:hypothetical protein